MTKPFPPVKIPSGTLLVEYVEALDAHCLFFQPDDGPRYCVAVHDQGVPLHILAKYCVERRSYVLPQLSHIRATGGLTCDFQVLTTISQ